MTNHNLKPAIKERPILFSAPMVRAILEGRKTQTRRVVHPRFTDHIKDLPDGPVRVKYEPWTNYKDEQMPPEWILYSSDDPEEVAFHLNQLFGAPGDRLWVRETFSQHPQHADIAYRADGEEFEDSDGFLWEPKWKPSIHMPRKFSRINLEITNISVERLQDISEEDARAEGILCSERSIYPDSDWPEFPMNYKHGFEYLWESINGDGSWDLNPWVWKIEFKRV